MINYEITSLNPTLMSMMVKYSIEGKQDYFVRVAFDVVTEEHIHAVAKKHAYQAEMFWERDEEAQTIEMSTLKGQTKHTVVEPRPDFDPARHKMVETVVEEADRIVVTWDLVDLDEDELAAAIRAKRDSLLRESDALALADRNMSQAMIDYREALRNIPQQEGFPSDIQWPLMPID